MRPSSHSSGLFLPFLPFLRLSITLSSPESQPSVRRGNITVVSFDALQPKYAVLFFKTLSIRLNEAYVSCLYLGCRAVLYILGLSEVHKHTRGHTHLHLILMFESLSLNF